MTGPYSKKSIKKYKSGIENYLALLQLPWITLSLFFSLYFFFLFFTFLFYFIKQSWSLVKHYFVTRFQSGLKTTWITNRSRKQSRKQHTIPRHRRRTRLVMRYNGQWDTRKKKSFESSHMFLPLPSLSTFSLVLYIIVIIRRSLCVTYECCARLVLLALRCLFPYFHWFLVKSYLFSIG